jgi:hypothetical protein
MNKIIKYLMPLSNCQQTDKDNKTAKQYLIEARKQYVDNIWKNYYTEIPGQYDQIIKEL